MWDSKSLDRCPWETLLSLSGAFPPGGAHTYSCLRDEFSEAGALPYSVYMPHFPQQALNSVGPHVSPVMKVKWPCFIPKHGLDPVLFFNIRDTNQSQEITWIPLPRKRKRGYFHWGRLARTEISRDSVSSPSVCSPISLLCHRSELMVLLECSGESFSVCSFFFTWESIVTVLHLQMRVQQEDFKKAHHYAHRRWCAQICMKFWNGYPEYKLGGLQIYQIYGKCKLSKHCILKLWWSSILKR